MKTLHQPQVAAVQAAAWPRQTVLEMNLWLLSRPDLDVQPWFEEQVAIHLGHSPHGGRTDASPNV